MGNFDKEFDKRLNRESWSFYGVGILVILLRLYARARKRGAANYQADDYLMILVAGLYAALIVSLNVIADGGGSNLYPPELEGTFTPTEVQERIYGSKIVVISEQAMLNVIYTIKACMLLMYMRLTFGLSDHAMVRYLAMYVAMGWLVTELAFFLACRPFSGYWAVPPPDPQCTTLENYALVQGCFNISADVLMLFIPIPLIVRMRLPWRQKIVLYFIFSLGVFVIIAALMTKIFNLTDVYNPNYMLWYVREASVAVCVSNLPMIWPLLREWFPGLKHLSPGFQPTSGATRHAFKWTPTSAAGGGTSSTSRGGGGARHGGMGSRIVTQESLVAKLRRKGLSTDEDIEMAMAAHGLGMHHVVVDHADDSSEEDLKSPPPPPVPPLPPGLRSFINKKTAGGVAASSSSSSSSSSSGHRWATLGMQSPPRVLSRCGSRTDSHGPDSVDLSFVKLLRMEHDARGVGLRGGIQVQTTVDVIEETAAPMPAGVRAVGGAAPVGSAMW